MVNKRKKTKKPDAAALDAAAAEVLNDAGDASIALIGGIAMQIYGSDRLTFDVDFIADEPVPLAKTSGTPTFGGVTGEASNGVKVDVIVRNDDYAALYEDALANADRSSPPPVVRPEWLAAMKLAARRPKDESDLLFLVQSETLDLDLTRKVIKKHMGFFAVEEFDACVQEALWLLERGKRK